MLIFDSRFESGNLRKAAKVNNIEYNLWLENDLNTKGHTQWFFFRIGNTRKGMKVVLNIINLAKPDSLYNYGMKVLNFSNKLNDSEGVGWHRIGENIDYYQNNFNNILKNKQYPRIY